MPVIAVKGMSCKHCCHSVTEAAGKVPGVTSVNVDLASGSLSWDGPSDKAALDAVKKAVEAIGFETS